MKRLRSATLSIALIAALAALPSLARGAETFGDVEASGLRWLHLSSRHGDLPVPTTSRQQTAAVVADLDKDGRNDFVLGFREKAPALVWYRRTATGWDRYVIEKEFLTIEAGGAVCDVDGDGWCDIYLCGLDSPNALYRNLGGWKFEDITARAGVACAGQDSTAAASLSIRPRKRNVTK